MDPLLGRTLTNISDQVTGDRTYRAPKVGGELGEFLFANSGTPARLMSTMRKFADPRKGTSNKLINFLSGLNTTDVSPAARDAIIRERSRDIMDDLGAQSFEKVYFTDERKAKMTPEQLQQVEVLELLRDLLESRSKRRAKTRK